MDGLSEGKRDVDSQNDSVANSTLQKIADERVTLRSMLREIDEARDAGNKASRALDAALDKLGSAEGMSIWDTFLGGGLLVSALKYSEINSSDDLSIMRSVHCDISRRN